MRGAEWLGVCVTVCLAVFALGSTPARGEPMHQRVHTVSVTGMSVQSAPCVGEYTARACVNVKNLVESFGEFVSARPASPPLSMVSGPATELLSEGEVSDSRGTRRHAKRGNKPAGYNKVMDLFGKATTDLTEASITPSAATSVRPSQPVGMSLTEVATGNGFDMECDTRFASDELVRNDCNVAQLVLAATSPSATEADQQEIMASLDKATFNDKVSEGWTATVQKLCTTMEGVEIGEGDPEGCGMQLKLLHEKLTSKYGQAGFDCGSKPTEKWADCVLGQKLARVQAYLTQGESVADALEVLEAEGDDATFETAPELNVFQEKLREACTGDLSKVQFGAGAKDSCGMILKDFLVAVEKTFGQNPLAPKIGTVGQAPVVAEPAMAAQAAPQMVQAEPAVTAAEGDMTTAASTTTAESGETLSAGEDALLDTIRMEVARQDGSKIVNGGILGRLHAAVQEESITAADVQMELQLGGFVVEDAAEALPLLDTLVTDGNLIDVQVGLSTDLITPGEAVAALTIEGLTNPGTTKAEILGTLMKLMGDGALTKANFIRKLVDKAVKKGINANGAKHNSTLEDLGSRIKEVQAQDAEHERQLKELQVKIDKEEPKSTESVEDAKAEAEESMKTMSTTTDVQMKRLEEEIKDMRTQLQDKKDQASDVKEMQAQLETMKKNMAHPKKSDSEQKSDSEHQKEGIAKKIEKTPAPMPESTIANSAHILKKFQGLFNSAKNSSPAGVADIIRESMQNEGLNIKENPLGERGEEQFSLGNVDFQHAVYGDGEDGSMSFLCFLPT